jgi:hypothetical protein
MIQEIVAAGEWLEARQQVERLEQRKKGGEYGRSRRSAGCASMISVAKER